jgi:hypothetical protein
MRQPFPILTLGLGAGGAFLGRQAAFGFGAGFGGDAVLC